MPLRELLERVAARTPAPGGGAVSACACGLAAALVEMAAQFGAGGAGGGDAGGGGGGAAVPEDVRARAAELRARSLQLADDDLTAYGPVLEAMRRPRDDPERSSAVAAALSQAAATPLAIAETGAELAGLAETVAEHGSRHLVGDAVTAAVLSEAACRAAVTLVELNLAGTDDPRLRTAVELAEAADVGRQRTLQHAE